VSAFGPTAAGVPRALATASGRSPTRTRRGTPSTHTRGACEDARNEPGEIILQAGFSWAQDDEAALDGARVWKSTLIHNHFADDWHDPRAMYERAEREVSDDDFKKAYIVSSDPEQHAERVRDIERLGATIVCLQNGSGAAPEQALRVYGEQVLPALRGARV